METLGRIKLVWGLKRLLPYIRQFIDSSRFIPTEDKDKLKSQVDGIYDILYDSIVREYGKVPITPSKEREWLKRVNDVRRKQGHEPLALER